MMPVDEVGTGVGYLQRALLCFEGDCFVREILSVLEARSLFVGRGSCGDEDVGSNAGSREGFESAGLFFPIIGGNSAMGGREVGMGAIV